MKEDFEKWFSVTWPANANFEVDETGIYKDGFVWHVWLGYKQGRKSAPTPPAQEDEPVTRFEMNGNDVVFAFSPQQLDRMKAMHGADLYTRPDNSELRKAAEGVSAAIEAQEGPIRGDLFTAWKSLRAALEGK